MSRAAATSRLVAAGLCAVASGLLAPAAGSRALGREAGRTVAAAVPAPSSVERVSRAVIAVLPRGLAPVQVLAPPLPAGDVEVSFPAPPRPGWISLLAVVRSRGREAGRAWVRVELKPLRRVLVAARDLAAGDPLEGDALRIEERPTGAGEGFAEGGAEGTQLVGARAAHDLAAGVVILDADVSRPPLVPRGTAVQLVVRRGRVTVTAPAVLERAARPGERTLARIASVGRLLQGRLVDPGTFVEEESTP